MLSERDTKGPEVAKLPSSLTSPGSSAPFTTDQGLSSWPWKARPHHRERQVTREPLSSGLQGEPWPETHRGLPVWPCRVCDCATSQMGTKGLGEAREQHASSRPRFQTRTACEDPADPGRLPTQGHPQERVEQRSDEPSASTSTVPPWLLTGPGADSDSH